MSELPRSGRPQGDAPGKKHISPAGIAGAVLLAVLWWAAYSRVQGVSSWLVFDALGLERESHVASRWNSSFTIRQKSCCCSLRSSTSFRGCAQG